MVQEWQQPQQQQQQDEAKEEKEENWDNVCYPSYLTEEMIWRTMQMEKVEEEMDEWWEQFHEEDLDPDSEYEGMVGRVAG